jgi:hypothetical protein
MQIHMKRMKTIYSIVLVLAVVSGCNNFDDDINKNPNKPSTASNTQLLAEAMRHLPETASGASANLYVQHWSEAEYITLSRYDNVFYNFYDWYSEPLANIEAVITSTTLNANEGPIPNQLAVAKVMKAYFFWYITDRWGDLPYTEALKGRENFTPAYDTQETIYNSLFALLDEADAQFVAGEISNDIVYDGDVDQWKKLGNTIHMLMALRLSKIAADKGKAEFNKALDRGILESNDDNLVYRHLADANNWNAWYDVFDQQNRYWYAVSEALVNYMQPVGDPRLPTFANTNDDGDYVGLKYGLTGEEVNTGDYEKEKISMLGDGMRQPTSPVYIVTFAEALFAQAEAAKLGWIAGGDGAAEQFYNDAILNSVKQWNNDDDTGVSDMMTQPGIPYDPADALKQISYQRWVHLFMNGYEAWAEWRRTGFPELVAPTDNNGREIPRREGYPTQEQQNNTQHYNEAVQRLGGNNDLNGHVWWDKK